MWTSSEDNLVYVLDTGKNKVFLKQETDHMFWRVSFEKGRIPNVLDGVFTSLITAQRAVDTYLKSK